MFLRLRLIRSVATVYSVALPIALVMAPVPAFAAPYAPTFAVDGDPIGNALALIIWFVVVLSLTSAAILFGLAIAASRANRSDTSAPVGRRVIR